MLNLKYQISNQKSANGFTLIELMVVVAIMTILVTAMSINLAGQRAPRDLRIAQNQLVSNIRLAQSYTLSARTLPSGQSAQYYLVKFDLSKPNQYTIQAVYNVSTSPQLADIQTVLLPPNIKMASITASVYPIVIDRSPANNVFNPSSASVYLQKPGVAPVPNCALIAFVAPFAKVIFNGGCAVSQPTPWDPNNDDYEKIVDFQTNIACDASHNPPACTVSTDSIMTITLTDAGQTISKTVTVNAVTGGVTFN